MNLFIPPLGTEIILAEPWEFSLFAEYRNFGALQHFLLVKEEESKWDLYRDVSYPIVLPKRTILKVVRIYIRKGASNFDSVTFWMKGSSNVAPFVKGKPKAFRFWAKLADVNRIVIEDST